MQAFASGPDFTRSQSGADPEQCSEFGGMDCELAEAMGCHVFAFAGLYHVFAFAVRCVLSESALSCTEIEEMRWGGQMMRGRK